MKKMMFLFLVLSLSSFAQTDWKATYEQMENKEELLTFEQYTEACEQGVENACEDGWYNKVIGEIVRNESGEAALNGKFLSKLEEVCGTTSLHMCNAALNKLSSSIESSAYESEPTFNQAKDLYNKFTKSNCEKLSGKSALCERMTRQEEEKLTYDSVLNTCLNSKDNAICEKSLEQAGRLFALDLKFIGDICVNEVIVTLPICEKYVLEQKRVAEAKIEYEKQHSQMILEIIMALGSIVSIIIFYFVSKTRCPKCKKYFAREQIHSEYLGTEVKHFTERKETGEIKNSNYQTIATIEQDVAMKKTTSHYLVTYKCKFCSHTWKDKESASEKTRA